MILQKAAKNSMDSAWEHCGNLKEKLSYKKNDTYSSNQEGFFCGGLRGLG